MFLGERVHLVVSTKNLGPVLGPPYDVIKTLKLQYPLNGIVLWRWLTLYWKGNNVLDVLIIISFEDVNNIYIWKLAHGHFHSYARASARLLSNCLNALLFGNKALSTNTTKYD